MNPSDRLPGIDEAPRIDVDALMRDLREEAARLHAPARAKAGMRPDAAARTSSEEDLPTATLLAKIGSIDRFEPDPRRRYDVDDIVCFEGPAFVEVAYLALFERPPQSDETMLYDRALRLGELDALGVITVLQAQPEARRIGARIEGLFLGRLRRTVARIPVVGMLLANIVELARLPRQWRRLRDLPRQRRREREVVGQAARAVERVHRTAESSEASFAWRLLEIEQDIYRGDERLGARLAALESLQDGAGTSGAWPEHHSVLPVATGAERRNEANALDEAHFRFEEQFRGARAEIKRRASVYLDVVHSAMEKSGGQPVLDIACGRGEWLELLYEQKCTARGVELNGSLVVFCKSHGQDVVHADALSYLGSQRDGTAGLITAFHLVEHLPFAGLLTLLREAFRVLAEGGALVLETPNPANLQVGSHTFYLDPTHRNPIPAEALRFFVEDAGFGGIETRWLHPYPSNVLLQGGEVAERLNHLLYGPCDYGIVAWKAVKAAQ